MTRKRTALALALLTLGACAGDELVTLKLVGELPADTPCAEYLERARSYLHSVVMTVMVDGERVDSTCVDFHEAGSPEDLARAFIDQGELIRGVTDGSATMLLEAHRESCQASRPPVAQSRLYCMQSGTLEDARGGALVARVDCPEACPGASRMPACASPTLVATQPEDALFEPAFTSNGLTLYARTGTDQLWYQTDRPSLDDGFEPWRVAEATFPSGAEDAAFTRGGSPFDTSLVLVQGPTTPRSLFTCEQVSGCVSEPLTLQKGGGLFVTGDVDGPSVIELGDELIVAFNVGNKIYSMRSANGIDWSYVSVVTGVNLQETNSAHDDPSIAEDGRLISYGTNLLAIPGSIGDPLGCVSPRKGNATCYDLWVATRSSADASFDVPIPLYETNIGDETETEPTIFTRPDGSFDLVFRRQNDILHSRCTLPQ